MLFRLPLDLPVEQRPVYGYRSASPDGGGNADVLKQYGDVRIKLKRDTDPRATFISEDSLALWNLEDRGGSVPMPVTDFRARGVTYPTFNAQERRGTNILTSTSIDDVTGRYNEVQVHGGVTLDDIEEIIFLAQPPATQVRWLKKTGVPWRVIKPT